MAHEIDLSLKKIIRRRYIDGTLRRNELARELHLDKGTIRKYELECREIEQKYPYKLNNLGFWIKKTFPPYKRRKKYDDMMRILPGLADDCRSGVICSKEMWLAYRQVYPDGYRLETFRENVDAWLLKNNFSIYHHRRIRNISLQDLEVLHNWRNSFERKKWQRATIILDSYACKNIIQTAQHVELTLPMALKWLEKFKAEGVDGLLDRPYTLSDERIAAKQQKTANISKLMHESPGIHGINRNTWTLELLTQKYIEVYQQSITSETVRIHLDLLGYKYRKSRQVLTSPDPKFREKVDHIKNILAHLQPDEKFFSVDEFGHFAVRIKGGWSHTLPAEQPVIPPKPKSKGVLLMTAALELSTNQLTHFYSAEKNTDEMIRLIDVLAQQYHDAKALYLSWDAAGWHKSKKLYEAIKERNSDDFRTVHQSPTIEIAPLPSSAQFLNVIESVFSGMARAVLHNSNYQDVEECKTAIDRYILERNEHFLQNPKRAGKYLWRLEKVKPVFDEANNCKTRVRISKNNNKNPAKENG